MPKAILTPHHQWYAAANIQIDAALAEQALEEGHLKLAAGVRIDVLDLRCSQCQQWYDAARGTDCSAATQGTAHLRGGPEGRRKRKCPTHLMAWDACEHLHEEPHNYGRPPMPAMAIA
ncbi:hypothetical protein ACQSSU_20680 [Micromonospora echinospora]